MILQSVRHLEMSSTADGPSLAGRGHEAWAGERADARPVSSTGVNVAGAPAVSAAPPVHHYRLELPSGPRSAGHARRITRDQLASWHAEAIEDTALLVVSEFVTNASLHGVGTIVVELQATADRLLVIVSDSGTGGELSVGTQDLAAIQGRGLGLVDVLSDSWGAERTSRGTTVWAELALSR